MKCPKCEDTMKAVTCDDIEIDRCIGCKGLWFDHGEAEQLSERWIAQFIDTGDAHIGESMDEMDNCACPRCGSRMKSYVSNIMPLLKFEECEQHGKYFDAGEFTLWAEVQYL